MADRTKISIALALAAAFGVMAIIVPNGWLFVVLVLICLGAALGVATADEQP